MPILGLAVLVSSVYSILFVWVSMQWSVIQNNGPDRLSLSCCQVMARALVRRPGPVVRFGVNFWLFRLFWIVSSPVVGSMALMRTASAKSA